MPPKSEPKEKTNQTTHTLQTQPYKRKRRNKVDYELNLRTGKKKTLNKRYRFEKRSPPLTVMVDKVLDRTGRIPMRDEYGRARGHGARKASHATVIIQPGKGAITVNDMLYTEYFNRLSDRVQITTPILVTNSVGKFDISIRCYGGGKTGQSGAVRLAIARALQRYDPLAFTPFLAGPLLTRDPRVVERKKYGRRKARERHAWVKR